MKFIQQFIQMQKMSVDILAIKVLLPQDIDNAIKQLVDNQNALYNKQG